MTTEPSMWEVYKRVGTLNKMPPAKWEITLNASAPGNWTSDKVTQTFQQILGNAGTVKNARRLEEK